MAKKYKVEADNSLVVSQAASQNVIGNEYAANTATFTGESEVQHKIKLTSSQLDIQDTASTNTILVLAVSSDLELIQDVQKQGTSAASAENTLDLQDSARSTVKKGSAESELELEQSVTVTQPIYESASNNLSGESSDIDSDDAIDASPYDPEEVVELTEDKGLRQEVSYSSIHNLAPISYLSLDQDARTTEIGEASNHLHLSQIAEVVLFEDVEQYIYFNFDASAYVVNWAEQTLDIEGLAEYNLIYTDSLTSSLELGSAASNILVNYCTWSEAPVLTRRSTTVLTWPYTSPTVTLELRNPDFDNVEQFEPRRINRRTRGGTLDLYRDSGWPKAKRLIYSFSYLSNTQRGDLLQFLQNSIGQEIGILDFESRQWRGVIITPSSLVSEPREDGHSISLEFEGELA